MKWLECLIDSDNKRLCSPCVGVFTPTPPRFVTSFAHKTHPAIGGILRLGESFALCVPPNLKVFDIIEHGTFLNVGDTIASIQTIEQPESSHHHNTMVSPADGFLTFGDGMNHLQPGDVIHPGQIIAVLEFMKIRMEITFDSDECCEFIQYLGPDHRAIRRGEAFLEYKKRPVS